MNNLAGSLFALILGIMLGGCLRGSLDDIASIEMSGWSLICLVTSVIILIYAQGG